MGAESLNARGPGIRCFPDNLGLVSTQVTSFQVLIVFATSMGTSASGYFDKFHG